MMALVHDMAEAIVGDITPECGVSEEEKYRREKKALEEMTSHLDPETRAHICGLWYEYEGGETEEAKLVKQIDKFEFALQAHEYKEQLGTDLSDFVGVINKTIHDEQLRAIYNLLNK